MQGRSAGSAENRCIEGDFNTDLKEWPMSEAPLAVPLWVVCYVLPSTHYQAGWSMPENFRRNVIGRIQE